MENKEYLVRLQINGKEEKWDFDLREDALAFYNNKAKDLYHQSGLPTRQTFLELCHLKQNSSRGTDYLALSNYMLEPVKSSIFL